jgi:hypothetical protein
MGTELETKETESQIIMVLGLRLKKKDSHPLQDPGPFSPTLSSGGLEMMKIYWNFVTVY